MNPTKISDILAEITALTQGGALPTGIMLTHKRLLDGAEFEREVKIHFFPSAVDAYDDSQCDDGIFDGDLLVIPSEGVLGIMVQAWPTAITVNHGAFERRAMPWDQIESGRYNEAVKAGEAIIAQWPGTAVAPDADDWAAESAREIRDEKPWQPVVRIAWYERDGEDIAREPGGLEWTMIASAEFEGKNIARVVRTDDKNRILIATVTDRLLTNIIVGTEHDVWYIKRGKGAAIIAAAMTDKRLAEAIAQQERETAEIRDLLEPVYDGDIPPAPVKAAPYRPTIGDRLLRTPRWVVVLLAVIIFVAVALVDALVIAPGILGALHGIFHGINGWLATVVHPYHGLNSGIVIGNPKIFVGVEWHGNPGIFACILEHGSCG